MTGSAVNNGVTIRNTSSSADLVLLKHFGPGNSELATDTGAVASERA